MSEPGDEGDPYLRSFQEAFGHELAAAVRILCPSTSARVLDCPCGDGFYTALLSSHVKAGRVIAADTSTACLARARDSIRSVRAGADVEFVEADAYALPFTDNSFDVVWCAQSFITLAEPVRALREMARVVTPGGRVIVLETDEYHHILLPWPVELELAIYRAVRTESRMRYGSGSKFAQSRRLRSEFLEVGLTPAGRYTVVADRVAPFAAPEKRFLERHLEYLRDFVYPEMTPRELEQFDRAVNPDSEGGLLNRPDGEMTCLAAVCYAAKDAQV